MENRSCLISKAIGNRAVPLIRVGEQNLTRIGQVELSVGPPRFVQEVGLIFEVSVHADRNAVGGTLDLDGIIEGDRSVVVDEVVVGPVIQSDLIPLIRWRGTHEDRPVDTVGSTFQLDLPIAVHVVRHDSSVRMAQYHLNVFLVCSRFEGGADDAARGNRSNDVVRSFVRRSELMGMGNARDDEFDAENLALDDPAVREMGNVKAVLSDVPGEKMNEQERSRLETLRRKTSELEELVRNRKTRENR